MNRTLQAIITMFICLWLAGCSMADWGLVHRIDVQQGNVIEQDALNQLTPGMTRRQVQYVLGSPMVADVFHQDRWDYFYVMRSAGRETGREHVTLHFEHDTLTRIDGTLHPQGQDAAAAAENQQVTLVVPARERVPPGLLNRIWHWMTFRDIEEQGR